MREESVSSHYAATVISTPLLWLKEWKALAGKKKKKDCIIKKKKKIPKCDLSHIYRNCPKHLFLSCRKFVQISGCLVDSFGEL